MYAGDSELSFDLVPSMCPLERPDSESKPADETLETEIVLNSASGHALDEIDISSESAEFSDSTKCGLEDPEINSPKVLLGKNFR